VIGRIAPDCKPDVHYATGASHPDGNPAFLTAVQLVFQKDVIPQEHILRIGTTNAMSRQVPFVLLVPVELTFTGHAFPVYINCTYTHKTSL